MHSASFMHSDLYVCHTTSFMHSALMAQGSQIQQRIRRGLCALLHTTTLDQTRSTIEYDKADAFLLGPDHSPPAMLDMVSWEFMHYKDPPNWEEILSTKSLYVAHASEVNNVPQHR